MLDVIRMEGIWQVELILAIYALHDRNDCHLYCRLLLGIQVSEYDQSLLVHGASCRQNCSFSLSYGVVILFKCCLFFLYFSDHFSVAYGGFKVTHYTIRVHRKGV